MKLAVQGRWPRTMIAAAAALGILAAAAAIIRANGGDGGPPGSTAVLARFTPVPATVASDSGSTDAAPAAAAPSRVESFRFASRTLGRTMPYIVYLPPGYDAGSLRRYPVLYMLHGLGGDYTEWYGYGLLKTADGLIRAGAIPPMIVVLPEGDGSYWVDHADGGPRWGAYTARDVVDEIDTRYRTLADRDHRAIGGLSMGGHGALQLAMNYPDVFGVAGAHSPTLRRHGDAPRYFGDEQQFQARDPISLIQAHPEVARTLKLWMDVGDGDFWLAPDTAFHDQLVRWNVPHEWHVYPGGHGGDYWTANREAYLRFYGAALGR